MSWNLSILDNISTSNLHCMNYMNLNMNYTDKISSTNSINFSNSSNSSNSNTKNWKHIDTLKTQGETENTVKNCQKLSGKQNIAIVYR